MTPKQKAEELWWSYYSTIEHTLSEEYSPHESYIAKQCALVAVNELINEFVFDDSDYADRRYAYWTKVFHEIDKL